MRSSTGRLSNLRDTGASRPRSLHFFSIHAKTPARNAGLPSRCSFLIAALFLSPDSLLLFSVDVETFSSSELSHPCQCVRNNSSISARALSFCAAIPAEVSLRQRFSRVLRSYRTWRSVIPRSRAISHCRKPRFHIRHTSVRRASYWELVLAFCRPVPGLLMRKTPDRNNSFY